MIAASAALLALILLPNYTADDDTRLTRQFVALHDDVSKSSTSSYALPIITFNIRIDIEEADTNNHFTKRVERIAALIQRLSAAVIGLQEPFSGQVMHLQSHLPKHYDVIGYNGGGHDKIDRANPIRHADYQTAVMYDTRRLLLIQSDHLWLSRTPRVERSSDWNSEGIRTVTIAHFKINTQSPSNDDDTPQLLVFNTHLDVFREEARYEQARLLAKIIAEWSAQHPTAVVLVLGDFNTAQNQRPYNALVTSNTELRLHDAWTACAASLKCVDQSFAASFHGWQGARLNTYGSRLLQLLVMSLHGSDLNLPRYIPTLQAMPAHALQIGRQLFSKLPTSLSELIGWWNSLPPFDRFHVDWILYSGPHDTSSDQTHWIIEPRMMFVADVRTANYSSDHFPVAGLFELFSAETAAVMIKK